MGSNFWLMVNPFRKCLVTGISELNRIGLTAPIGIVPTSMHRHRAHAPQSPLVINQQPVIDRLDMVVDRFAKRFVGHVHSLLEQRVTSFFAHVRIVIQGQGSGYSYFPIVDFVHVATVVQVNANKNVRGLTL